MIGVALAVNGVESGEHLRFAGIESLVGLAFLLKADNHFVGLRAGDGIVADGLDFAATETLRGERVAELVHVRSFGETHIHVGAALEVDAVRKTATRRATLEEYGCPSDDEKKQTQPEEELGLAHPVDIWLFE